MSKKENTPQEKPNRNGGLGAIGIGQAKKTRLELYKVELDSCHGVRVPNFMGQFTVNTNKQIGPESLSSLWSEVPHD